MKEAKEVLEEIKSKLTFADYPKIAKLADTSANYVGQVIRGERRCRKGKALQIKEIAIAYIKMNEEFINQLTKE